MARAKVLLPFRLLGFPCMRGNGSHATTVTVFPVYVGMAPVSLIRVTFWGSFITIRKPSGFLIFSHSFCKSRHSCGMLVVLTL